MKGRGANVLVNRVNVTCSGSRCIHIEWLFRWSENCVLVRSLAREFVWIVSYAMFAQSSYLECVTYLQRARFIIKNRTVLAQVTSALLCVMCYVCFGSFGNRGTTQIVGVVK
jgi:hypothetical protein